MHAVSRASKVAEEDTSRDNNNSEIDAAFRACFTHQICRGSPGFRPSKPAEPLVEMGPLAQPWRSAKKISWGAAPAHRITSDAQAQARPASAIESTPASLEMM